MNRLFYQPPHEQDLECRVQVFKPFLDFAFRFESGYTVQFPLRQFEGEANTLYTFLQITPEGGKTILLGETFGIPAMPAALRQKVNLKRFSDEGEVSGAFAMGEGTYHLDLLVIDGHHRAFQKTWRVTAAARGKEKLAAITMPPLTAASAMLMGRRDDAKKKDAAGPRLTVLLDAAPIVPRSLNLRAWDRAFLLGSLSSLLGDASYSSVRVVAFNLDQQVELFRQENFGRADFRELAIALRKLELGKVSYRTIQDQQGWSQLLARLVNEEAAAKEPSDAVIFLGPRARIEEKVPPEMLRLEGATPRFFYFEYFAYVGRDFPDTVHYLTNACKGTVLKLHSPAELAEGIRKMQRMLKENGTRAAVAARG